VQDYYDAIAANLSCPDELGRILLRIIDEGALAARIDELLEGVVDGEPQHIRFTNSTSMMLHAEERYTLHLRRFGGRMDFATLGAGGGQLLATPGGPCVGVFRHQRALRIVEYRPAHDGCCLLPLREFDYAGEVLFEDPLDPIVRDYKCDGHAWMLRLNHGQRVSESRYFDRQTLEFTFASAVKGVSSSLVTLCQVFGASQDVGALEYLHELTKDEAYFVRWAAIQAIGKIDGNAALVVLEKAANDPHPMIRNAAERTLRSIGTRHG
jgi:HEAT repeats